jgi:hypothetical protein
MAPKNRFSKGWQHFVDHKWSKKRSMGALRVLALEAIYEEFLYVRAGSQPFPDNLASLRRQPLL